MSYLAKSRQVLQLEDPEKLHKLLQEQRAELQKLNMCFGKKRGTRFSPAHAPTSDKKATRNVRKNIARIMTRLNQLKQMESKN